MTEPAEDAAYPSLMRRYLSTAIDGCLVISSFLAAPYVLPGNDAGARNARVALFATLIFLYEPVLTSRWHTLGQRVMGIRVRDGKTGRQIGIPRAFLRTFVKGLLGFLSFFTIPLTPRMRALHDYAAGSIVVYADE